MPEGYFNDFEGYKVKIIEHLLDSVGIAAPIPNEQIVKHLAYISRFKTIECQTIFVHVIPKDILRQPKRTNDFRQIENKTKHVGFY